jgi:transcriptional antiterminator RfaH
LDLSNNRISRVKNHENDMKESLDNFNSNESAENHSKMTMDRAFWYCLRTQPQQEMFAFNSLRHLELEAFFPRIRYRSTRRRQGQWLIEPLFPNYLFCKFDLYQQARAVKYAPGVSHLIHFGNQCPTIPSEVIQKLQSAFILETPTTVEQTIKIGDHVLIEAGPMQGCEGIVSEVLPGKKRAELLLEFLGQQTRLKIDLSLIQTPCDPRIMLGKIGDL